MSPSPDCVMDTAGVGAVQSMRVPTVYMYVKDWMIGLCVCVCVCVYVCVCVCVCV